MAMTAGGPGNTRFAPGVREGAEAARGMAAFAVAAWAEVMVVVAARAVEKVAAGAGVADTEAVAVAEAPAALMG